MKKLISVILTMLLIFTFAACGGGSGGNGGGGSARSDQPKTGVDAIDVIGEDGIDWNHMSMEELYEKAKQEGGVVKIYATTTDANTAKKKIARDYPDVEWEFVQCDTDEVKGMIERDYDSGKIYADVLLVKDSSGEIYTDLVQYDIVKVYYPAVICEHISDDLLQYGLPLYSTFNPWFYNTRDFPDGVPIKSWWDIVQGYNPDTKSYVDANGNNTQYWHIYTKGIKAPSYAALWAQLIEDSDALFAQYKEQYGEDLVITYTDKLQNSNFKSFPENNAGVELFWRFSQMKSFELSDGDAVVTAVNESVNGPTLGLCSASKLDNRDMGMDIAWVTGLSPYTAQDAAAYVYVVSECDNPAGARLYINYILGGEDGQSGCYTTFDKLGHWSVRDDVTYQKSGINYEEVGLKAPDFGKIFEYYSSVGSYWDLWSSWSKK
jgi:iron(III) transport system substrate-binding protein